MSGWRAALASLLLFGLLCGCSQPLSVEQQIIATIREMETRIENGERRPFMSHFADDFSGQGGSLNRDQVRAMVVFQLNRHQRLQARLFPIVVREPSEGEATASFRVLVTGGPSWIPESGQVFDFETRWRLADGEWLIYSAEWAPVELDRALEEIL